MRRFAESLGALAKLGAGLGLVFGLIGSLLLSLPTDSISLEYPLALTESNELCSPTQTFSTPWTVDASELEDVAGGDIVPVRSLADPYPSLHSVAVDPDNNRVLISDSNRGALRIYDRTSGSGSSGVVEPMTQVRGPATGMMFVAGVALDPGNHELFAVNNDIGDRMEVFPYDSEGNVKPKRVLFVPHGSWGVALNRQREEIAITVEDVNTVVVDRRDASLGDAPLRVLHGPKTGLGDPHGITFDEKHNEISVANHGNWAPLTRAESLAGKLQGGRFDLPSITTYSGEANKDAVPLRKIQGSRTALSGPMGVSIDAKNEEIWVTNYREHTAAVFARTAQGNVAPKRIVRNALAGTPAVGFGNPGAVAYDSKRDEILVPN